MVLPCVLFRTIFMRYGPIFSKFCISGIACAITSYLSRIYSYVLTDIRNKYIFKSYTVFISLPSAGIITFMFTGGGGEGGGLHLVAHHCLLPLFPPRPFLWIGCFLLWILSLCPWRNFCMSPSLNDLNYLCQ